LLNGAGCGDKDILRLPATFSQPLKQRVAFRSLIEVKRLGIKLGN
jgi:hypothetical protein